MKPKCYSCIYRGNIEGNAHSRCNHPENKKSDNPLAEVLAIFAGVGRAAPIANINALKKLNIQADAYGIQRGWFNWPYNFDPVWLRNCDGYKEKIP